MIGRTPDYLDANVGYWQGRREDQLPLARGKWSADEPNWGIFGIAEGDVGMFPTTLEGARAVELGCGTAYVSAWMARRGAHAIAVDPTPGQLGIARQMQDEFAITFPLVLAGGEQVPFRDGSFDFAISEYGAAIWADPYRWIPEAARLLRRGGELVFLGNSTQLMLCVPDDAELPPTDRLLRAQFGMHRFEWPDDPTVEFHLAHGDWIRLLRTNGFVVENLIELRPAEGSADATSPLVTAEWARKWPCEEVWRARRQ